MTRPPPDHVDEEVTHTLRECPCCEGPVEQVGEEERFTEELIPARMRVTRHRIGKYQCPAGCGTFSAPDLLQIIWDYATV
ncbi:MAG: IS66 family transposase zinc-finger binding domain-containing protein [Euryarchaeota archaeon]|nr:IS66 family transposase zinc-finger binding domain-containing protein [Euryarchaeota archaeon]